MQHLSAFYESIDPGNVLSNLAAVQDQVVFTSGDDIRVPTDLSFIIGEVGLTAAINLDQARVVSPSLRRVINIDVKPVVNAVTFGSPPESMMHVLNPVPVMADEAVNFQLQSDPAVPEAHYGLVWFADGPQQPINGNIYSLRATSAVVLSVGQWVNGNLTFAQTLPVGRYQVVGLRARGANLVAARLVFVGGTWRPGVPALNASPDLDAHPFRYGRMGVYGEFHTNTPPTVDCLGITDASQVFMLDVLPIG